LTRSRLAALKALSQAISEAVLQGNLDRAAHLLEQRQTALQNLDWSGAHPQQLNEELQAIWAMERKLLDFCRTWREVLQDRLQSLSAGSLLRQRYRPAPSGPIYLDCHE
jgi:hypothetical protein